MDLPEGLQRAISILDDEIESEGQAREAFKACKVALVIGQAAIEQNASLVERNKALEEEVRQLRVARRGEG